MCRYINPNRTRVTKVTLALSSLKIPSLCLASMGLPLCSIPGGLSVSVHPAIYLSSVEERPEHLALLLFSCVTLSNLFLLSKPQFPHL